MLKIELTNNMKRHIQNVLNYMVCASNKLTKEGTGVYERLLKYDKNAMDMLVKQDLILVDLMELLSVPLN